MRARLAAPAGRAARAQRLRAIIGGRQTRIDIAVASTLLGVSLVATLLNLLLAGLTFPGARTCGIAGGCTGHEFDLYALALVLSLVVGTTFGVHAVLKLLNRRNAWVYALGDAIVSVGCLVGALLMVPPAF